jgi:hypothetical protein
MSNFVVTQLAMRPASLKQQCFYCQERIGATHKDDCVLIRKDVVVKFEIEIPVRVPAFWTEEQVEFHRNQGTWCASNVLDELEKIEKDNGCLCQQAEFSFVKETSEAYLDES